MNNLKNIVCVVNMLISFFATSLNWIGLGWNGHSYFDSFSSIAFLLFCIFSFGLNTMALTRNNRLLNHLAFGNIIIVIIWVFIVPIFFTSLVRSAPL